MICAGCSIQCSCEPFSPTHLGGEEKPGPVPRPIGRGGLLQQLHGLHTPRSHGQKGKVRQLLLVIFLSQFSSRDSGNSRKREA